MEILRISPDKQGTRIQGKGGIALFHELWMKDKITQLVNKQSIKVKQSNTDEARK